MNNIPAFPKILALGTRGTETLLEGSVEVTEKIDGSQFSFGLIDGVLRMRSKGVELFVEEHAKMFSKAVEFAQSVEGIIPDNTVFHGEFLGSPKHNTLEYDRVPTGGFMMFGMRTLGNGETVDTFHPRRNLEAWAEMLGCEVIPLVHDGWIEKGSLLETLDKWLEQASALGKAPIEGVVIKNYEATMIIGGQYIPIMSAKYVSENFKEKHEVSWGKSNPTNLEKIGQMLNAEPRWAKAVQRLKEEDALDNSPKDIGMLMKSINQDIEEEEKEQIKEYLYNLFRKDILRMATRGFPEWYKQQLVENIDTSENENVEAA